MTTLLDASHRIVLMDSPAEELRLADRYMDLWAKDPDQFILPNKHAHLAPIIAAYAKKRERFPNFVRGVRDEVEYRAGTISTAYVELQEFVRTLDMRYAQQLRRARLSAAAQWLRESRPDLSADQRQQWLKRVEQRWAVERREMIKEAKERKGERLTRQEMREILDWYWDDLSSRCQNGDLPTYEELMDGS